MNAPILPHTSEQLFIASLTQAGLHQIRMNPVQPRKAKSRTELKKQKTARVMTAAVANTAT